VHRSRLNTFFVELCDLTHGMMGVRTMGLWDKLMKARNYFRERRGPDSYFRYKRMRQDERKAAEQGRERAKDDVQRERGAAERAREYEERYTADRESDISGKRTERPEEIGPEP
jgi:hypothetical protein